jgi:fermentation-respiration switch protein FrsA (DUF1100 family)
LQLKLDPLGGGRIVLKTRFILSLSAVSCIAVTTAIWVYAGLLVAPVPRVIGAPPSTLPGAIRAEFESESGSRIVGWFAKPQSPMGTVVLAHSVRSDRRAMASRASFLLAAGYSVLLYDSQAHGESHGSAITFGHLESLDATAAVAFARAQNPAAPVAFLGVSQGGAAALLARPPLDVSAMVLEAVYPTIRQATENRITMRLGPLGQYFAPLFLLQLSPRLGVAAEDLEPIRAAHRLASPALFIAGELDQHTTLEESRSLYRAAPEPKELWVLPGAAHENFHARAGEEYERRVLDFFSSHGSPR